MKEKKTYLRVVAAMLATALVMTPIVSHIRIRAWSTPIGSGTIHMTHNSTCAELYHSGNPEGTSNCNAKAVVKDGSWIPVYCVEKGKYLNDTDYVTASLYSNNDWCDKYGMPSRDAIGMIYVCGYNGRNGWGEVQAAIFDHDAEDETLMANSNYHKYVATQALIWEVITGNSYASRNSSVQSAIDTLRARVRNYMSRESLAASTSGSIRVYTSESDAKANPNLQTSVSSGVGHFAYNYGYYTPANKASVSGPAQNQSTSDFTMNVQNEIATFGWTRVYGNSAEAGQAGQVIYELDANNASELWGVVLWSPDNGNQLTISATAYTESVYAAFKFQYEQIEYQAAATLNTIKVDENGNPARGATFTVYRSNGTALGTMTDANANGHYSFSLSATEFADVGRFYYDSDENGNPIKENITRSYTVKETSPATEVYEDGSWKTRKCQSSNTTYSIGISIARDTGKMTWTSTGSAGGSASRSANQTVGAITFGDSGKNGSVVNYQLVNANADFTIEKVDELGLKARGATFGIYTDASCTKESNITLSYISDGMFGSSQISWGNRQKSSDVQTEVLYIKEKTPATQIQVNGEWVDATCELDPTVKTVRIVWNPEDGSIYAELFDGSVTEFASATPKIIKSGSFDGTTSTLHADLTSAPWINVPYVYAEADITIKKVDDQERDARGAEFTVYSDEKCTNAIGAMTDIEQNGYFVYSEIQLEKKLRSETNQQSSVFYIKETKQADQILYDGEWLSIDCKLDDSVRKVTIFWTPSTGAISSVMEIEGKEPITITGEYNEQTFISSIHADFTDDPVVNTISSTGSMTIEKRDDKTGERLTGATFRVYNDVNSNGEFDEKDTVYCDTLEDTDGDGIYLLENMPLDRSYLVIETEAPEFYETDSNYYPFSLTPTMRNVTIDNKDWKVIEGVPGSFLNHNPIIKTTLVDATTQEHVTVVRETVKLIDTVEYSGLHVGEEYVMTGTLYDKKTGKPILDKDGNGIASLVTFVPDATDGVVEVPFEINTEVLRKTEIVAGETVYHTGKDRAVGIHFDLEDEAQTVQVPDIHTTLTDDGTNEHIASYEKVELTDVIAYENLVPGLEYTVSGYLVDKKTNEVLKNENGEVIVSSTTFVPTERDGLVSVVFTFDRSLVENTSLVAFESLYLGETLIVEHNDITDVDQTVFFPMIRTAASVNAKHEFYPEEEITLVDSVSYGNLIPGKTYELKGLLMKENGSAFEVDGTPLESTVRFVPETADGAVEVVFKFNAASLKKGDKLVAYEKLYLVETGENDSENQILITTHEDLTDEGQTVTVIEKPKVPKTGDTGSSKNLLLGLASVAVGGAIAFLVIKKKKDK